MNSVVYVLSFLARTVFVSVPYRVISAMATFVGAGTRKSSDSDLKKTFGTNDNDSKSVDSHDSDSDDESFTCEYDSTWDEEVDTRVTTKVIPSYLVLVSSRWTTESRVTWARASFNFFQVD